MDNLYTCADIADRYSVKIHTVWGWVRRKKLPAIKIGKEYRFRQEDLLEFEKARETMPVDEQAS